MLFSILIIILYYSICYFALDTKSNEGLLVKYKQYFKARVVLFLIFTFAAVGILGVILLRQNNFIYFWDYSGYWISSICKMNYIFEHSIWDNLYNLIKSINHDDYNCLLPSIIALPLKCIGFSFSKYVFINYVMFLVPTIIVQTLIAFKLLDNPKNWYIYFIIALLFPANYYCMLKGYIDIACLLPASIAIFHLVDFDFKKVSIRNNISIALMLVLTWISRRYFIYFIIGYVFAMAFKAILQYVKDKTIIKNIFRNLLIISSTSLGILLVVFPVFFVNALITNYRAMYSAYDDTIINKFSALNNSFGLYSFIIIFIVGLFCFIYKKHRANYLMFCLFIMSSSFAFWQTQVMGVHHRIIINIPILCIFIILASFWNIGKNKLTQNIGNSIILISLLLFIVNFLFVFASPNLKINSKLFSQKYVSMSRHDIPTLKKLAFDLNNITQNSDKHIYILASGVILNSDLLKNIYLPNYLNAIPNMFRTHDVDLRDGFPSEFINADYLVTTIPVDLHLKTGQEVVRYLAENVNKNDYIGKHYRKIKSYNLDNNYKAIVYEEVSNLNESDFNKLVDYYDALYPDYSNIFKEKIKSKRNLKNE